MRIGTRARCMLEEWRTHGALRYWGETRTMNAGADVDLMAYDLDGEVYSLIPVIGEPGAYVAVYADGSYSRWNPPAPRPRSLPDRSFALGDRLEAVLTGPIGILRDEHGLGTA